MLAMRKSMGRGLILAMRQVYRCALRFGPFPAGKARPNGGKQESIWIWGQMAAGLSLMAVCVAHATVPKHRFATFDATR